MSTAIILSQNHLDVYLNVKGHDLMVELLSATGSTQMACVRSKCGDEDVISIVTDVHDSSPIHGPPGTKCSPDRRVYKRYGLGLCSRQNEFDFIWESIQKGKEKFGITEGPPLLSPSQIDG
ncbi:Protein CBG07852 [Caenorhabditis briggsae]|uniref:Protein CBG07852 n=1 Tax=Caenorhabditis briggsae TaxID=6238 RepID=A8X599_CAEBR|nr:Protein CBG07852 [Caenorhabditis briggsae]CAP27798.1 Protein CBG07852 [Caenorhabditis briggsae]